ncbi:MAG: signal recognition particle-docking protein FtsY [Firmicutes bacterium]|nr:signal recognition particle-docking protein FtsY [Bacillota bacterium]
MGFFKKIAAGLRKTKDAIASKIDNLFSSSVDEVEVEQEIEQVVGQEIEVAEQEVDSDEILQQPKQSQQPQPLDKKAEKALAKQEKREAKARAKQEKVETKRQAKEEKKQIKLEKKRIRVFEKLTDDFYDDLEDILISSDFGLEAAEDIVDTLRKKVRKNSINTREGVIAALRESIAELLDYQPIEFVSPTVLTIVGVNGVGKTTAIGKLANIYRKDKSVVIAAADTFRAAAVDQLATWAERSGVRLIKHADGADPSSVVYDAIQSAKAKHTDLTIIDTAGRLHNKSHLMEELKKVSRTINKNYPEANRVNLIVLDATTGQNALSQVKIFNEAIDIDGIILTKLDGTAKGGVVLAIKKMLNIPVLFIGVGEGIDDLEVFNPADFANAIV